MNKKDNGYIKAGLEDAWPSDLVNQLVAAREAPEKNGPFIRANLKRLFSTEQVANAPMLHEAIEEPFKFQTNRIQWLLGHVGDIEDPERRAVATELGAYYLDMGPELMQTHMLPRLKEVAAGGDLIPPEEYEPFIEYFLTNFAPLLNMPPRGSTADPSEQINRLLNLGYYITGPSRDNIDWRCEVNSLQFRYSMEGVLAQMGDKLQAAQVNPATRERLRATVEAMSQHQRLLETPLPPEKQIKRLTLDQYYFLYNNLPNTLDNLTWQLHYREIVAHFGSLSATADLGFLSETEMGFEIVQRILAEANKRLWHAIVRGNQPPEYLNRDAINSLIEFLPYDNAVIVSQAELDKVPVLDWHKIKAGRYALYKLNQPLSSFMPQHGEPPEYNEYEFEDLE